MIYLCATLVLIIALLGRWVYVERRDVKWWKDKYAKLKKDYDHFINIIVLRDRRRKIEERKK